MLTVGGFTLIGFGLWLALGQSAKAGPRGPVGPAGPPGPIVVVPAPVTSASVVSAPVARTSAPIFYVVKNLNGSVAFRTTDSTAAIAYARSLNVAGITVWNEATGQLVFEATGGAGTVRRTYIPPAPTYSPRATVARPIQVLPDPATSTAAGAGRPLRGGPLGGSAPFAAPHTVARHSARGPINRKLIGAWS